MFKRPQQLKTYIKPFEQIRKSEKRKENKGFSMTPPMQKKELPPKSKKKLKKRKENKGFLHPGTQKIKKT